MHEVLEQSPSFVNKHDVLTIEPSFLQEYRECSSEYEVPDKQSSGEISDEGEF